MAAKNVPVICYDLPTVSKFFRSVALTVATQKSITVEWQRYRDSRVLNFFYGLKSVFMESEGPGSVEVQVGGAKEVEAEADRLHAQYLSAWVRKVFESGPAAGNSYVAQMLSLGRIAAA